MAFPNLINAKNPPRVPGHEHALYVRPERADDPADNGDVPRKVIEGFALSHLPV